MRVAMDRSGRIVIPKHLRDRLALTGGEEIEIYEFDDRIEIRRPADDAPLVPTSAGLLTMPPGPGLGAEEVRTLLEQSRR